MGICYGDRVIGEVKAASVHGYQGLGASQLRFSVSWNIYPRRDDLFTVFGTFIWVSARAEGESEWQMLGQAVPETAWSEECRSGNPLEWPLLYRLTLPNPQLLAIEDARKGRGMSFQLDVRGQVQGPENIRSLDSTVTLHVNASDWVRVLKEANAAEVLLVGVQLPAADSNGKCRAAIDLVRKANVHLLEGNYDTAVAKCRLAIESLWRATALEKHAQDARKLLATMPERKSMTKLGRELALGEALLNFTHPAHHVGTDAEPEIFGRLDAAFVVAATAGLISSLAAMPERLAGQVADTLPSTVPPVAKLAADVGKEAGAVPMAEQVARVRDHLANSPSNRPRTMKSLKTAVDSLFGKKLGPNLLDALMGELRKQKVFIEVDGKPTYADPKK